MEVQMAGVTVSFVADPVLADRVKEIARSDGVTPSQAAARASALGVLLPASARRTLRFILTEGGSEDQRQLAVLMAKAIGQVGSMVLERQLLESARDGGLSGEEETEAEIDREAVQAVKDYHREQREANGIHGPGQPSRSAGRRN
jgi:hypothetical protein